TRRPASRIGREPMLCSTSRTIASETAASGPIVIGRRPLAFRTSRTCIGLPPFRASRLPARAGWDVMWGHDVRKDGTGDGETRAYPDLAHGGLQPSSLRVPLA